MKKQIASYAIMAIFASFLLMASTASFASAQTTSIRYNGQSSDASWNYENNGVYTDVYVFATDSASRQGSTVITDNGVYVGVYQYTLGNQMCSSYDGQQYCYNEYIPLKEYFGYATVDPSAFQTQGRLDGATLHGSIPGYDYMSDSPKTINLDITWTGQGDYSSGKSNYQYHSSSFSYHGQYSGLYRQATATGSISGGITMDLGSSSYGTLYSARSGSVDIIHN